MKRLLIASLVACSGSLWGNVISWTDWTTATIAAAGSATGTLGGITVTYTGQLSAQTQTGAGTNYWSPSAPYLYGIVGNAPPANDVLTISSAGTRTFTFSSAVTNPIIAIVSLNSNSYTFSVPVTLLTTGTNTGFWGPGSGTVTSGNVLTPTAEFHGVLQLNGTFTSFNLTAKTAENWNGFTIGLDTGVPEPGSLLLGASALLAGVWRLRRRRG